MIKDEIIEKLKESLKKIGGNDEEIDLQPPVNADFGDYSTSIALKLSKQLKKNPMVIAEDIKKNYEKIDLIEKIEIVKPGFINFLIKNNHLLDFTRRLTKEEFNFPKFYLGKNKKIMIEFAHPNTHKLFHIGHLRNISTGESMVRILETVGNNVIRTNYQGDIGLHIAKCLYGIQKSKFKSQKFKTLKEKIDCIGKMYSEGTRAYEDDPKAKEEIIKINKQIYDQDPEILPIWRETKNWSLEYFDKVYVRVDSHFDRLYLESEVTKRGIEISSELLKKDILKKSEGAVVFDGDKFGLDTRVFINSLGYPTYEGKELGLAEKEFSDFGQLDKILHVVTPEQKSFFKVTFKVEELSDENKYKGKQNHLVYEWVRLKAGKMSSREGNVIEANWLIDELKNKIIEKFKTDPATAEILAVASAKYSFLKHSLQTIIAFDIDESVSVEGNSAPYLIYTFVRCQSVLKKSQISNPKSQSFDLTQDDPERSRMGQIQILNLKSDELNLLRKLYQFPEIVLKSAQQYSPNFIATYLYELASLFNLFYQKNPILKSEESLKQLRLLITLATANVLKKGLYLLGIKTVERM